MMGRPKGTTRRKVREGCLSVTKKDVAVREIKMAIRLFFEHEDIVSAHVLAGAAFDIISGIAKDSGAVTTMGLALGTARPEVREAFEAAVKFDYNFFKHGSRDPHAVNDSYHPQFTENLLYLAVADYLAVYDDPFIEGNLFLAWFVARHPDAVVADAPMAAFRGVIFPASTDTDPLEVAAGYGRALMDDLKKHPRLHEDFKIAAAESRANRLRLAPDVPDQAAERGDQ